MAEFKWHLMAEEWPEYGMRDYVVMGPKGRLRTARGFKESMGGPLRPKFVTSRTGYDCIRVDEVYAWAEIPPLDTGGART